MKRKLLLALLCFTTLPLCLSAQNRVYDTTTINIMRDVAGMQAHWVSQTFASFTASMYVTETDTITRRDTAYMNYQVADNEFNVLIYPDTMRVIQNQQLNVTVYKSDSVIVVRLPEPLEKRLFQLNVEDESFQELALRMLIRSDSGLYQRVTFLFDSASVYKAGKMAFHKDNNELLYVTYTVELPDAAANKIVQVVIRYSGYSYTKPQNTTFSADGYVRLYSQSDLRIPAGQYSGFELINLITATNNP
jgi:hypothetical protein